MICDDHLYRKKNYSIIIAEKVEALPQRRESEPEFIILNEYADRGTFYRPNKQELLIPNINYLHLHYIKNFILLDRY